MRSDIILLAAMLSAFFYGMAAELVRSKLGTNRDGIGRAASVGIAAAFVFSWLLFSVLLHG